VCPPGLHISLGIFNRLWELIENACNELDLHLAEFEEGGDFGNTFDKYASALKKRDALKLTLPQKEQTATTLEQLVTFFSLTLPNPLTNVTLINLRQEASKARLESDALVITHVTE
jgi:hypothetical protein